MNPIIAAAIGRTSRITPSVSGGGGSSPFDTVYLDTFESGMKTYGPTDVWATYTGEGAAGTTVVSTSAAKVGTYGLRTPLSADTMYMHFYCNNGSVWSFAHERLLTGTWTREKYNRMGFWVRHPSTQAADTGNGHNVELGTYTRAEAGDPATQNDGGNHFYHYYNPLPGVWTYCIVDPHPQHSVGGGTSDPGLQTSPTTDGTTWWYFDSLTRFYWNIPYLAPSGYPADFDFDEFIFYEDTNTNEDVTHVMSLEASYNPSTHLLHVGFCRSTVGGADVTYTAKYALSDIWTLGFANATAMGTSTADGQGDYVNKKIEATIDLTGQSEVYIAVQMAGQTYFRQIRLIL